VQIEEEEEERAGMIVVYMGSWGQRRNSRRNVYIHTHTHTHWHTHTSQGSVVKVCWGTDCHVKKEERINTREASKEKLIMHKARERERERERRRERTRLVYQAQPLVL
jgi:hypothetical protein